MAELDIDKLLTAQEKRNVKAKIAGWVGRQVEAEAQALARKYAKEWVVANKDMIQKEVNLTMEKRVKKLMTKIHIEVGDTW